jgi:hypothetical protein
MILTPAQRKSCERALATAHTEEDRISYLEKLAAVSPAMAERVKQLRERQQWIIQFTQTALSADDASIRTG